MNLLTPFICNKFSEVLPLHSVRDDRSLSDRAENHVIPPKSSDGTYAITTLPHSHFRQEQGYRINLWYSGLKKNIDFMSWNCGVYQSFLKVMSMVTRRSFITMTESFR